MKKTISAADANRRFSELLRTVRKGKTVVVTSHGRPVARIVPMTEEDPTERGARVALFARLRSQSVVDIGQWSRDELYEGRR